MTGRELVAAAIGGIILAVAFASWPRLVSWWIQVWN